MEKNQKKSKFNVKNDKKSIEKRTFNGIIFDSDMERKYYTDVLLPAKERGEVVSIELQPKFMLQDSYVKYGRKILPIYYVADFQVVYRDGSEVTIDIKGLVPEVAKIKRKIWDCVYPNKILKWITLSIKYGGWIDCSELQRLRRIDKRRNSTNAKTDL